MYSSRKPRCFKASEGTSNASRTRAGAGVRVEINRANRADVSFVAIFRNTADENSREKVDTCEVLTSTLIAHRSRADGARLHH
jgi:hypothetical protein